MVLRNYEVSLNEFCYGHDLYFCVQCQPKTSCFHVNVDAGFVIGTHSASNLTFIYIHLFKYFSSISQFENNKYVY